jgi:hypothetical protein
MKKMVKIVLALAIIGYVFSIMINVKKALNDDYEGEELGI